MQAQLKFNGQRSVRPCTPFNVVSAGSPAHVALRRLPVPRAAAPALADTNSNDVASKAATVGVAVYSAANYVIDFMSEPLTAVFPNIQFLSAKLDATTTKLAEGCEVVCLFVNDDCDAKVIAGLKQAGVKLIAMRCAGFDRVDLAAAEAAGITVVRVPTYAPTSVAEHSVTLLLSLNRHITNAYMRVRQGNYALSGLVGSELRGKTVGVLGTGAIGSEAARIFHGIGMKVLAYDIRENPAVTGLGIPYFKTPEEVVQLSDVISLHLPLLPSTSKFINRERVAMMKPGAILLNVSRGGLVDTDAVIEGLESGQIGGFGADVYEEEGDLFFTDWTALNDQQRMKFWDRKFKSLLSYPQVIVTPHSAFLTHEALANIAITTVGNIKEYLAGGPLTNKVELRK